MLRFYESKPIVENYSKYRPNYPPEITELALGDLKGKQLDILVDVGCGTGISVQPFVPHFRKVLAIDPSENQIERANLQNKFPHVIYQVGFAEKLPCENESVDVITTGTALHWFDRPQFYKEVSRVLKPGGRLVAFGYNLPELMPANPCSSDNMSKFEKDLFQKFLMTVAQSNPDKRLAYQTIQNGYYNILHELPFEEKQQKGPLYTECLWRFEDLKGMIKSIDLYETFTKNKEDEFKHLPDDKKHQKLLEEDMTEVFSHMLRKSWDCLDMKESDIRIKAVFEICTIVARK